MMKGDGIEDRKLREALERLAGFRKSENGRALTEARLTEVNARIAEARKSVVVAERRIASLTATLDSVKAAVSDLNILNPSDFAAVKHKHEQSDVSGLTEALATIAEVVKAGNGANGAYLRFDAGWQICWITGVTFAFSDADHLNYSWTYPAAFKTGVIPFRTVSFSNAAGDLTGVTLQQLGQTRLGSGATVAVTRIARAQGAASFAAGNQIANCQIFAFGQWK